MPNPNRPKRRLLFDEEGHVYMIVAKRPAYLALLKNLEGSNLRGLPPDVPARVRSIISTFAACVGRFGKTFTFSGDPAGLLEMLSDPRTLRAHLSNICTIASSLEVHLHEFRTLAILSAQEIRRRTLSKKHKNFTEED